jgi:hypothetical protein
MVVRLSALCAGRRLHPRKIPDTHSVYDIVKQSPSWGSQLTTFCFLCNQPYDSLWSSPQPAICPYLKANEFRIRLHILNFEYFNIIALSAYRGPPLWSSAQSFWLQTQRSEVWFRAVPDFLRSRGSGTVSTQSREDNWGATGMKK